MICNGSILPYNEHAMAMNHCIILTYEAIVKTIAYLNICNCCCNELGKKLTFKHKIAYNDMKLLQ